MKTITELHHEAISLLRKRTRIKLKIRELGAEISTIEAELGTIDDQIKQATEEQPETQP